MPAKLDMVDQNSVSAGQVRSDQIRSVQAGRRNQEAAKGNPGQEAGWPSLSRACCCRAIEARSKKQEAAACRLQLGGPGLLNRGERARIEQSRIYGQTKLVKASRTERIRTNILCAGNSKQMQLIKRMECAHT